MSRGVRMRVRSSETGSVLVFDSDSALASSEHGPDVTFVCSVVIPWFSIDGAHSTIRPSTRFTVVARSFINFEDFRELGLTAKHADHAEADFRNFLLAYSAYSAVNLRHEKH